MTVQTKTAKTICQAANCRKKATAKFCSTSCRMAAHRKAQPKAVKTAAEYMTGPFWTALYNHLQRAGTVEASPYNVGEYAKLDKLFKLCASFNGDEGRTFEISHIVPASKGGFTNLQNVVIAPVALNRAHGSTHFGFGEAVDMSQADPRFMINKDTSHDTIRDLLITLHSEAFMLKEAKAIKQSKSTRAADLKQVLMIFNPCSEVQTSLLFSVEFINTLTGRQMKEALAIVKGESTAPIYFAPATPEASVAAQELARMAEYRPEFKEAAEALTAALSTQKHAPTSLYTAGHAQIVFNLLHGKTLVQSIFDSIVESNTLVFRVRYGKGFDFHTIEAEAQAYWMQDHAQDVFFTTQLAITQELANRAEAPF